MTRGLTVFQLLKRERTRHPYIFMAYECGVEYICVRFGFQHVPCAQDGRLWVYGMEDRFGSRHVFEPMGKEKSRAPRVVFGIRPDDPTCPRFIREQPALGGAADIPHWVSESRPKHVEPAILSLVRLMQRHRNHGTTS